MRYPVDNYKTEWNGTAGYGYGDATAYGFHDGVDINDNGGGNSDLGKPLYAIAKGKVVGIHSHPTTGFGNHLFIQIDGPWGTRYVHYAHCLEILVQQGQDINEGQLIAKVGNSGTVYAHCHFAIKKKTSGMDDVANNRAELDDIWEDPIAFIEKNMTISTPPQDNNYQKGSGKFDQVVRKEHDLKLIDYDNPDRYYDNDDVVNAIQILYEKNINLTSINKQQADMIESLRKQIGSAPATDCELKIKQINTIANSSWLTWLKSRVKVKELSN